MNVAVNINVARGGLFLCNRGALVVGDWIAAGALAERASRTLPAMESVAGLATGAHLWEDWWIVDHFVE